MSCNVMVSVFADVQGQTRRIARLWTPRDQIVKRVAEALRLYDAYYGTNITTSHVRIEVEPD